MILMDEEHHDAFQDTYNKELKKLQNQKAIKDAKEKAQKDFSKGSKPKEIMKKVVKGINWIIKVSK